ncbi:MAG: DUF2339 domain-containing protein [Puniceicoccaceae bacterium]
MTAQTPDPRGDDLRAVVIDLSERLKAVEARLGIATPEREPEAASPEGPEVVETAAREQRDSLEFEVGQNWFAIIGIVALAIGMAFLLSLPFGGLPPWLPSVAGFIISGILFLLARVSRHSFGILSKLLRGAGMLLLFFATLRFFYFGEVPALGTESIVGRLLLILVLGANLLLAWRRESQPLFFLAMLTGYATAVAVDATGFLLGLVTVLALVAVYVRVQKQWRNLAPLSFVLSIVTYVIWAVGNPIVGNEAAVQREAQFAVYFIPLWMAVFSLGTLLRQNLEQEHTNVQVTGLLVCGIGFGTFFLHNLIAFDTTFIISHLVASAVLLVLAVAFWKREESWFSTFIYAMTGYMALSFALMKAFEVPEVFVALSLESLVVIATAIYFRSPFIIVTNCLIFIGIIVGYVVVAEAEQGMSIGFGVVALVSARVLNWQQERLSLKTDLMRNAYLAIAFVVFPYALYYLVPKVFVAVSWVGVALFYYGMNLYMRNRKYRWMGHMTLILTALYVLIIGTSQLESHYRIITFFVLGTIMLVVSLAFTMVRGKRQDNQETGESGE